MRVLHTTIKRGATIGAGAVILLGLVIGAGAVVGAGTAVTQDVLAAVTVVGSRPGQTHGRRRALTPRTRVGRSTDGWRRLRGSAPR